MRRTLVRLALALVGLALLAPAALAAPAATATVKTPSVQVSLPGSGSDPGTNLSILAVFTLITLGPSLLIMMTGFTRILIVIGFLRNALGTPQIPPNQVLVGFSLFLTLFVMGPTFSTDQQGRAAAVPGEEDRREDRDDPRRGAAADVHAEADGSLRARDVREALAADAAEDARTT